METEDKLKEETIDWAKRYLASGLTVIPIAYKTKHPMEGVPLHEFWDRKPTEEELDKWFPPNTHNGIGIVVSGNLMGIDIDDPAILPILYRTKTIDELAKGTWVSKTNGGYHIYLDMGEANKRKEPIYVLNSDGVRLVEVYFEKHTLIEEPSIHKSGKTYRWITDISKVKIKKLDKKGGKGLIDELIRYERHYPLIDYMIPRWKNSVRHDTIMFLGGAMRKSGIDVEDAIWIIDAIATGAGDNDSRGRVATMRRNYGKPSGEIKGYTGLTGLFGKEVADKILTYLPHTEKDSNGDNADDDDIPEEWEYLTLDKDGLPNGIDVAKLVRHLMEDYIFLTFDDSKEVLYYKDGIYAFGGEVLIEGECQQCIPMEFAAKYLHRCCIDEIIGNIQRLTYIDRKEFDARRDGLLIVDNGVINIETGEFKEHSSDILALSKSPIKYNPDAVCPQIEKFVDEIINEDELPLLQEFSGYVLYPSLPTHKSFWCYGSGRNGKDTFFSILSNLIGEENISNTDISTLENNRFAPAGLYGKSLNISGEVSPKSLYQMNVFKALTGGTPIDVEKKFGHAFKFKYSGKMVVFGNKMPKIFEDTVALWERILIVRFPHQFLDNDPHTIKDLAGKLSTPDEMSGFLNWALTGLKRLKDNNWMFSSSKTADEMKAEFLTQSNPVRAFFDTCCIVEKGGWIATAKLYDAYLDYSHDEGLGDEESLKGFGYRLGNISGIYADRRNVKGKGKQSGWRNVALKEDKEDEPNDDGTWNWRDD